MYDKNGSIASHTVTYPASTAAAETSAGVTLLDSEDGAGERVVGVNMSGMN